MTIQQRLFAFWPWLDGYNGTTLKGDVFGGILAAVVLLPVSLTLGTASGLGPEAGLYGAIAVVLCGALFGGVNALIRGPNILLALIMTALVAANTENLREVLTVVMMAGVLQILFGLLKFGRFVAYIPYPLLAGVFTTMGILLVTAHIMLLLEGSPGLNLFSMIAGLRKEDIVLNGDALLIAALSFAIAAVWRGRAKRFLPSPVIILVAGWLAGVFLLRDAPTLENIRLGFPPLTLPVIWDDNVWRHLPTAFLLALLSALSTLIMAFLADSLTGNQHRPDRELVGLGMGNIVAGMFGGVPGGPSGGDLTNMYSGGRTPVAGIIVALLLLTIVLAPGSPALFATLPYAVLYAIVVVVSLTAIDWNFLRHIKQVSRADASVFWVVLGLGIFHHVGIAIAAGLFLYALLSIRRTEAAELRQLISVPLLDRLVLGDDVPLEDPFAAQSGVVVVPPSVSMASARELSRIVTANVQIHRAVVFDMSRTTYMDISAANIIGQIVNIALDRQTKSIVIAGLSDEVAATFNSLGLLDRIPEAHFAEDMAGARRIVGRILRENAAAG